MLYTILFHRCINWNLACLSRQVTSPKDRLLHVCFPYQRIGQPHIIRLYRPPSASGGGGLRGGLEEHSVLRRAAHRISSRWQGSTPHFDVTSATQDRDCRPLRVQRDGMKTRRRDSNVFGAACAMQGVPEPTGRDIERKERMLEIG